MLSEGRSARPGAPRFPGGAAHAPIGHPTGHTTMEYMIAFSEPTSEFARRNDPTHAPAY
jgi:hypothetical protein